MGTVPEARVAPGAALEMQDRPGPGALLPLATTPHPAPQRNERPLSTPLGMELASLCYLFLFLPEGVQKLRAD